LEKLTPFWYLPIRAVAQLKSYVWEQQDPNLLAEKDSLAILRWDIERKNLKMNLSKWELPQEEVKEYLNDESTHGIFCKQMGPESCNCSCTYRAFGMNSGKIITDYETKETRGKLTDTHYQKSVSTKDFKGARTTSTLSSTKWRHSELGFIKTHLKESKKTKDL